MRRDLRLDFSGGATSLDCPLADLHGHLTYSLAPAVRHVWSSTLGVLGKLACDGMSVDLLRELCGLVSRLGQSEDGMARLCGLGFPYEALWTVARGADGDSGRWALRVLGHVCLVGSLPGGVMQSADAVQWLMDVIGEERCAVLSLFAAICVAAPFLIAPVVADLERLGILRNDRSSIRFVVLALKSGLDWRAGYYEVLERALARGSLGARRMVLDLLRTRPTLLRESAALADLFLRGLRGWRGDRVGGVIAVDILRVLARDEVLEVPIGRREMAGLLMGMCDGQSVVSAAAMWAMEEVADAVPSAFLKRVRAELDSGSLPYQVAEAAVALLLNYGFFAGAWRFLPSCDVRPRLLRRFLAALREGAPCLEVDEAVKQDLGDVAMEGSADGLLAERILDLLP